jgi:hypothetical protein
MYNVNYGFEHAVNIALTRLDIQIGLPLLEQLKKGCN